MKIGSRYIAQAGLELVVQGSPPSSTSQVLGLQACIITHNKFYFLSLKHAMLSAVQVKAAGAPAVVSQASLQGSDSFSVGLCRNALHAPLCLPVDGKRPLWTMWLLLPSSFEH